MSEQLDIVMELIDLIGGTLNAGQCSDKRFCLIVWCDCAERPDFIGGNEDNTGRTVKMLNLASESVLTVQCQPRGSA